MKPHIKKSLEEMHQHFENETSPTSKQSDLRDRNLRLLKETPNDWESLSSSATYRHKTGQSILNSIVKRFSHTEFFFAVHALSSSALQSVDSFVEDYREWLNDAEIPENFVVYATNWKAHHNIAFKSDVSHSSTIRSPKGPLNEDTFGPKPSKRRRTSTDESDLPTVHPGNESLNIRASEEMLSDNDSEELEEAEAEPLPTDAPMGGSVYVLKRLDAIGALVSEPHPHVKLTMPHHEFRPFITFQCSETIAKDILKKRKRIM